MHPLCSLHSTLIVNQTSMRACHRFSAAYSTAPYDRPINQLGLVLYTACTSTCLNSSALLRLKMLEPRNYFPAKIAAKTRTIPL